MINTTIISKTVKDFYKAMPIIFLLSILAFIFVILIFAIELYVENGSITSLKILNSYIEERNFFYLKSGLLGIISILWFFLMLVLILHSANIFPETFNNPLLGIILTKNISLTNLLTSQFIGQVLGVLISFFFTGIGISLIIFIKTKGLFLFEPLIISMMIFYEFISLFSFIAILSVFIKKSSSIVFIAILFYWGGNSIIKLLEIQNSPLVFVKFIFPYTKDIHQQTENLLNSYPVDYLALFIPFAQIIVYLLIAKYFFKKKEL